MANKVWADWNDAVLPALPGLPSAMAAFTIKRAAIEFCDRSMCWRAAIPAFAATINVPTYTLAAPIAETQVVRVLEFRYLGKELIQKSPEWLRAHYGNQDWRLLVGTPLYCVSELPNQMRVVPMPDVTTAGALSGWAAIKPTDAATGLDEAIWREYHDEIASLAKARAMEVPKKPYSDKVWAKELHQAVDHRIGMIAYKMARGGGGPLRTKTHWT